MAFEDSAGINVNNFYGPRASGGTEGLIKTEGAYNEAAVNFDAAGNQDVVIPVGAIVVDVVDLYTGTLSTITAGGTSLASVDLDTGVTATVGAGGVVVATGPTAGTVIVRYYNIA